MSDNALFDILRTQAYSALAAFSGQCDEAQRKREFDDLLGAAILTGQGDFENKLRTLQTSLMNGEAEAIAALKEMASDLELVGRQSTEPDAAPKDSRRDQTTEADAPRQETTSTQIRRPRSEPRRGTFSTGEHQTLLQFFRDEAQEGLHKISELLMGLPGSSPDSAVLHEIMGLTHAIKGAAGTVELTAVARLAHEFESAIEQVRHGELVWTQDLRERFLHICDQLQIVLSEPGGAETFSRGATRLRNILEKLTEPWENEASEDTNLQVSDERANVSFTERRRPERRGRDTLVLRIDPVKVDGLMNSVGELVFDRTRIQRRVADLERKLELLLESVENADQVVSASEIRSIIDGLKEDTSLLERTEFAIQDGLTSVRMQSVHTVFERITPQLRAITRDTKKQVRLITTGGDTEFDKSVADQLIDPLIQLLRNSVAHGIESPLVRTQRGKAEEGNIQVSARHEGNIVVLEVSDDGAGIDVETLRARLVESGQWAQEKAARASDESVLQSIFEAGTSTRAEVDVLAGHGVGLSSVRETVTRLGGEIQVANHPGHGTSFTIRLPLTTAVAEAVLFKVGGHVFAVPSVHVRRSYPVSQVESSPVLDLRDLLGFHHKETSAFLMVEYLGRSFSMICDKVVGPREIVVKKLGPLLDNLPLYSGGTISPSGKVQLIFDTATLVGLAYEDSPRNDRKRTETVSDFPRHRILLVDDSRTTREAMRHMLEPAGFQILMASDGSEAMSMLRGNRFDAVVTDLDMPGMDGFSLLESMGKSPTLADISTLVVTSKSTPDNRERARNLGAQDLLAKPVGQNELVDALRSALRERPTSG